MQYKAGWRIYKIKDVFPNTPSERELNILCDRMGIQAVVFDTLDLLFIKTIHNV